MVGVNVAVFTRIAQCMWPATEWDGVTIFLTEKAHPNEFTVPDIMPTVMTPETSSGLLV